MFLFTNSNSISAHDDRAVLQRKKETSNENVKVIDHNAVPVEHDQQNSMFSRQLNNNNNGKNDVNTIRQDNQNPSNTNTNHDIVTSKVNLLIDAVNTNLEQTHTNETTHSNHTNTTSKESVNTHPSPTADATIIIAKDNHTSTADNQTSTADNQTVSAINQTTGSTEESKNNAEPNIEDTPTTTTTTTTNEKVTKTINPLELNERLGLRVPTTKLSDNNERNNVPTFNSPKHFRAPAHDDTDPNTDDNDDFSEDLS